MKGWRALVAGAGVAAALAVGSAAQAQTPTEPSVGDIVDEPENWIGRQVTVSDDVTDVIGPRAFQMGEEDFLGLFGGTELLVVGARNLPQWVGNDFAESGFFDDDGDYDELQGAVARANGTVRRFNLAEVERELGVDLDDALFEDFDGDPVLVAQSVRFMFEADEVAEDFRQFWGRRIAAVGEVTEVLGPRAFVLDDDVVVVTTGPLSNQIEVGARAVVQGTVREFLIRTFENQLGIDLDDDLFVDWEERPGIVATSVQVRTEGT
jgi:hypothetical protein